MAINTVDYLKTQKGPSMVYFGLAVPAATLELTIGAGGVPDPTENPNAKLVGLTEAGAEGAISKTEEEEFFDEFEEPLSSTISQTGMSIKVKACQILDHDVLSVASAGVGTPQTVALKKKLTIGKGVITNTGIAIITPTKADGTKYIVFHIYSGHNMSNVNIPFSRVTRASMDLEFKGVGITSRAAVDRMGAIWWNTAA